MINDLIPIIAILSSVALPVGFGMYLGLRSMKQKHSEHMELIKQGIVPAPQAKSTPNSLRSLRNGMLCTGIALGMLASYLLTGDTMFWGQNMFVTAGSVLFFLGIAYVAFYFVSKDKMENQDKE